MTLELSDRDGAILNGADDTSGLLFEFHASEAPQVGLRSTICVLHYLIVLISSYLILQVATAGARQATRDGNRVQEHVGGNQSPIYDCVHKTY
jgi:lysylphosphatidylglycerol synthetase-like protein (DUF2156 family)